MHKTETLVIGAGIAGLTIARELHMQGRSVMCIDKARGTGGRMSSKRLAADNGAALSFDLGCSSFTATSNAFRQEVDSWISKGIADIWFADNDGKEHFVGVTRNSAITRHLSKELDILFSVRAGMIEKQPDGTWLVHQCIDASDPQSAPVPFAIAEQIVITVPPLQALDILPENHPLRHPLESSRLFAQWVVLAETDSPFDASVPLKVFDDEIIRSVSCETSKPQRDTSGNTLLQIQATVDWSENNTERSADQVIEMLIQRAEQLTGHSLSVKASHAHRWLYSVAGASAHNQECYFSEDGIGLASDYFKKNDGISGVEASWLSARALLMLPALCAKETDAL